jgi:hypothetical protein
MLGIRLFLFMPILVLVVVWIDSKKTAANETDGLPFARGLGLFCSALPTIEELISEVPTLYSRGWRVYIIPSCTIAGVLSGLAAILLYLFAARGAERIMGILALMISLCFVLFLAWAGSF